MRFYYAIKLGLVDGYNEPFELSSGMTWAESPRTNWLYDWAVNAGQVFGAALQAQWIIDRKEK